MIAAHLRKERALTRCRYSVENCPPPPARERPVACYNFEKPRVRRVNRDACRRGAGAQLLKGLLEDKLRRTWAALAPAGPPPRLAQAAPAAVAVVLAARRAVDASAARRGALTSLPANYYDRQARMVVDMEPVERDADDAARAADDAVDHLVREANGGSEFYVPGRGEALTAALTRAAREFEGEDAYVAAAMQQILRHLEENVGKLHRGDWAGPGLLSLDQRKASLRALGERLEAQEGQWKELKERYEEMGKGEAADQERAQLSAEEKRVAEAVRNEPGASSRGRLRDMYTSTVNKVEMQVEAMCGLVEGVEALVRKAEAASSDLQRMHHREMFKHFPHHASPQKLVKMLARSVAA